MRRKIILLLAGSGSQLWQHVRVPQERFQIEPFLGPPQTHPIWNLSWGECSAQASELGQTPSWLPSADRQRIWCMSCVSKLHFKIVLLLYNMSVLWKSRSVPVCCFRSKTFLWATTLDPHTGGGSDGKESVCNEGDLDLIPGLGRFPGEGNGNSLQYSCLENPMDRGAWRVTVHGVTKSLMWLSS